MATNHCMKEAIWLRQLLVNVEYVQEGPTSIIMCDNQGSIIIAKNPTHHCCIKYIDVQHHFIREKLENKEISLKYCPTEDMIMEVLP
jgi:hypothetical protein